MIKLMRPTLRLKPEPTPEIELPPRDRLAAHLAECARLRERVVNLASVGQLAEEANKKEAEAQALLDKIAEEETEALAQWSRNPDRPVPNRAEDRAKVVALLNPLRDEAATARQKAEAIAPKLDEAQREYVALASQTARFVREVLLEQAHHLAQGYYQAIDECQAYEALLIGLQDALRLQDDGPGVTELAHLLNGSVEEREALRQISSKHREKGRCFPNQVASNPQSLLAIEA